jgi:hypothetical protein
MDRNGRIAILNTLSFQVPDFCQGFGYEIMGIEGVGHEHCK